MSQTAQFISLIGTKEKTFDQFKEALQKIGSKIEIYSNSNYFGFSLSGFDDYLPQTLDLLSEFMMDMHVRADDVSKLEKLVESSKIIREREVKDPSTTGRALKDFAMYGKKSPFLRRSTIDEVKDMTPEYLINQANEAMKYELDIFYTGTIEKSKVSNYINTHLEINDNLTDMIKKYLRKGLISFSNFILDGIVIISFSLFFLTSL